MPAMAAFIIQPLDEAHISEYTRIEEEAFGPDALQNLMFPPEATKDSYGPWAAMTCKKKLLYEPACRLLTVKNLKTGELMSGARWYFYDSPQQFEDSVSQSAKDLVTPKGSNPELYKIFRNIMDDSCKKQMLGRAFYRLSLLVTLPKYQRQGAGTALINYGTDAADKLGLPCYLEASPKGYDLYLKFGFKRVDELNIDLKPYGVDSKWTVVVMVRPAKPKPA